MAILVIIIILPHIFVKNKIPPFSFPWQLRQSLFYLCEVWSEFNIFCTLVTMATAAILNFFNLPKAGTHYGGYSYKVS
jgi:hypothetical protein